MPLVPGSCIGVLVMLSATYSADIHGCDCGLRRPEHVPFSPVILGDDPMIHIRGSKWEGPGAVGALLCLI